MIQNQKMIQSLPKKSYTPLGLDWRALKARVGDEEFNEDSDAEASDVNHLENQSVAEENHGS